MIENISPVESVAVSESADCSQTSQLPEGQLRRQLVALIFPRQQSRRRSRATSANAVSPVLVLLQLLKGHAELRASPPATRADPKQKPPHGGMRRLPVLDGLDGTGGDLTKPISFNDVSEERFRDLARRA